MMDYTKLVEALRCCTQNPPETCVGCTYNIGNNECAVRRMMTDAADAIEELMKNLNTASQELSWTISYAMHLMRDIDELHDMVNEVYYDEL